jgi:hypothetical protein
MGDRYELQIRYILVKFVFVALKYKGWIGLSEHALHKKAEPYNPRSGKTISVCPNHKMCLSVHLPYNSKLLVNS